MKKIITIGLDLAKSVFQIHGVGPDGSVEVRRKLRRSELLTYFSRQSPCLVGMEACGGTHYWAREITALGHEVRLIPPAYVKPYVKRGKTERRMRRPSARRSLGQPCDSFRSRAPNSRPTRWC